MTEHAKCRGCGAKAEIFDSSMLSDGRFFAMVGCSKNCGWEAPYAVRPTRDEAEAKAWAEWDRVMGNKQ